MNCILKASGAQRRGRALPSAVDPFSLFVSCAFGGPTLLLTHVLTVRPCVDPNELALPSLTSFGALLPCDASHDARWRYARARAVLRVVALTGCDQDDGRREKKPGRPRLHSRLASRLHDISKYAEKSSNVQSRQNLEEVQRQSTAGRAGRVGRARAGGGDHPQGASAPIDAHRRRRGWSRSRRARRARRAAGAGRAGRAAGDGRAGGAAGDGPGGAAGDDGRPARNGRPSRHAMMAARETRAMRTRRAVSRDERRRRRPGSPGSRREIGAQRRCDDEEDDGRRSPVPAVAISPSCCTTRHISSSRAVLLPRRQQSTGEGTRPWLRVCVVVLSSQD